MWRDYSRAKKLPSDFVVTLSRECSLAQQVWAEAKKTSNFRQFLPNLRTVLSLKREEAEYLGYKDSPYDALLDVYEPGSTIATLRPLFAQIKERLVPLLKKIQQSPVQIDDSIFLHFVRSGATTGVRPLGLDRHGLRLRTGTSRLVGSPLHHILPSD